MSPPSQPNSLRELYGHRFGPEERARKNALWRVLCQSFLQRYVSQSDVVMDLGAGYCEFINNIRCARKLALDLSEVARDHAGPDVTVIVKPATDLAYLDRASVDVVFASNVFEHLPSKDELMTVLSGIHHVLRPGGRLLILQPNIRYAYKEYWDYFDHYIPLSHRSLTEALQLAGFAVDEVRPRFLPYTFKSPLPQSRFLLEIYLRLPPLHLLVGKQMFLVAAKGHS